MSSASTTGRWVLALILLAFIGAWLVTRRPAEGPVLPSTGPLEDRRKEVVQAGVEANATGHVMAQAASGEVACIEQHIDVAMEGKSQRHCMGRTQVVQNGNVRTFRVEEQGGTGRWLRVDAAGEMIVAVEMRADDGASYACKWSKCAGVSVGPHDAQGARSIVLDKARLSRMKGVDDTATDELICLSGRIRTIPDDQLPATTCVGQLLYVSIGAGTVHFCPDGGTGFDLEDDGDTTFRFTNGDGESLGVRVNREGRLRRVEYGRFACTAPACTGVDIAPADVQGRRNFQFRGTTLVEQGGAASALLNGNVVLAAQ